MNNDPKQSKHIMTDKEIEKIQILNQQRQRAQERGEIPKGHAS